MQSDDINKDQLFPESYKGKIKDKYHFSEKLASGGFGIVYKAEDRQTGKKFAIKAIQKKKLKDFHTFVNEVKILQALVSLTKFVLSFLGPSKYYQALRNLGME
jgi:serine/threonine protein kinase